MLSRFSSDKHTKTQCVKACLDLAPKSDDYCNDTCADECKAMKEGTKGTRRFLRQNQTRGCKEKSTTSSIKARYSSFDEMIMIDL